MVTAAAGRIDHGHASACSGPGRWRASRRSHDDFSGTILVLDGATSIAVVSARIGNRAC
jgi:hypothetical protein